MAQTQSINMVNPTCDGSGIFVSLQSIMACNFHSAHVINAVNAMGLTKNGAKPSKSSLGALNEYLNELDRSYQIQGVDFSRAQLDILIRARNAGLPIEFETLGPYLIDYMQYDGRIQASNLVPEDKIGLSLAGVMRQFLPAARLVSLYDEYNIRKGHMPELENTPQFTPQNVHDFRTSLIQLFHDASVISDGTGDEDFLLIAESSKVADAERLVNQLTVRGFIARHGDEVTFVNDKAENPLYSRIILRTKRGRWLCEALDAAAFLKPENQKITHVVALPSYMKAQQDKVWEILRTFDIPLSNYHNIFYDPTMAPQDVVAVVKEAFKVAEILVGA